MAVRQGGQVQRLQPAPDGVGIASAEEPQGRLHLGPHRLGVEERVGLLGHVGHRDDGLHLAPGSSGRPGQGPQQGGLAGSVAPEHGDDLTFGDVQVDASQHRRLPMVDGQRPHPHQGTSQRSGAAPDGRASAGPTGGAFDRPSGGAFGQTDGVAVAAGRGPGVAHGQRRRGPAEEAAEVRNRRSARHLGQHCGRLPVGHHRSTGHHHGPVGQRTCPFETVLGHDDGGAQVVVEAAHRREDVVGALGIEHRRGFVEHQDGGRRCQRPGDGATLALTARQGRGGTMAQVGHAEGVEHLFHPPPHGGAVGPEVLQHEGDVVLDVVHHELGLGSLVDEPDHIGQIPGAMGGDRSPAGHNVAREPAVRAVGHQAVDRAQQGRLARTRAPHHQHDLAGFGDQVDGPEGDGAVGVGEGGLAPADRTRGRRCRHNPAFRATPAGSTAPDPATAEAAPSRLPPAGLSSALAGGRGRGRPTWPGTAPATGRTTET